MSLPNPDMDPVPGPGSLYPALVNITTVDLVGPSAANRQELQLEVRTDTLKDRVNKLIANTDYLETVLFGIIRPTDATFLFRDGTLAMTGNLNFGGFKGTSLVMTDPAGTSSEAANKNYVDAAVSVVGNYVLKTGDNMSGNLVLDNSQGLMGREFALPHTPRYLAYVDAGNVAMFGDGALVTKLVGYGGDILVSAGGPAGQRIGGIAALANSVPLYGVDFAGNLRQMVHLFSDNILYIGADGVIPTLIRGNGILLATTTYLNPGLGLYGYDGAVAAHHIASVAAIDGRVWLGAQDGGAQLVLQAPNIGSGRGAYIVAVSPDTPTGSMMWHAGNDGPGSNLQADLHAMVAERRAGDLNEFTTGDIIFETKVSDVDNAYNNVTGYWTCQVNGLYNITLYISYAGFSGLAGNVSATLYTYIKHNIAIAGRSVTNLSSTAPWTYWSSSIVNDVCVNLVAGDTIHAETDQVNSPGSGVNIFAHLPGQLSLKIKRIG